MNDFGTALQQIADAMNLSVAEVEDAVSKINEAFAPRPIDGELGRSRDQLQWLQTATTGSGCPVPRVYRGLECLASANPPPVRRATCRKAAWFGENGWPADWEAFGITPPGAD